MAYTGVGTIGQDLTSNAPGTLPSWHTEPAELTTVNIQTFIASGTYTPTANMKFCIIEMVGGGGGGGGATNPGGNQFCAGTGGGGGEYAAGVFNAAAIGASKPVTIGAGGAAETAGGTTSVGVLITAIGGGAGVAGSPQTTVSNSQDPVPGGTGGAGGNVRFAGGGAAGSWVTPTAVMASAGYGGISRFSDGVGGITLQNSSLAQTTPGTNATGFGGGGSGGLSFGVGSGTAPGGTGSSGIVVITEYIST